MSSDLRHPIAQHRALLLQGGSVALALVIWAGVTWGPAESRLLSPLTLPSPQEVASHIPSLWFDAALSRSIMWSLGRILAGFGIAVLIGVPLGIFAACFRSVESFMRPQVVFMRNVPVAALIPLTLVWFGLGELQKVAFLFLAAIGFVIFDTTRAVLDVDERYLQTAYTLGADRKTTIFKVLVPLAMPDIVNSLRLLFGLAFGYIVLAELIDAKYGLGYIIQVAQRRGPREHIYLVLFVITIIAFSIDRLTLYAQKKAFPYRFENQ